ncbi:glucose oxidase [Aspergillus lentulus]|uniref:glucose oxidase n=1 Tax=Aspergillus lentulus TaxID=293939 RepID=A0ABQ1AUP3_ASPLE|nr:glucose oxidase [Aspergillus lentulus]GFG14850.1 glucose oxidase [Aspergillus lentulus]
MKHFPLLWLILAARTLSEPVQVPFQDPPSSRIAPDATGVISNPEKVKDQTYDYIIAGGGLTGLTIAAKLLDHQDKFNVLVIENGYYGSEYGPIIDDLNTYGEIFGSTVDHAYETSPQIHKRVEIIRSGNGLGGSTLINGGTWTRPHRDQVDSWEHVFGNKGWKWDSLKKYMDEIEKPRDPTKDKDVTEGHHHPYNPDCHNSNPDEGKVEVGARDRKTNWSPLIFALMQTANETTGAPYQQDLCCGVPYGVSMFLNTLTKEQVRTDAARSWLEPVLRNDSSKNRITVPTGQLVGKVNLELDSTEKDEPKYKAKGVEFGTHRKEGWSFNVTAKEEVLLAAGSTISPLILQYSGIGPTDVLANPKVKIEQKIDLPVGLNMQDQTTTTVLARTTPEGNGQGQVAYFATFEEVFGEHAEYYKSLVNHNETLREWAAETVAGGGFHNQSALFLQYVNYQNWLLGKNNVSYAELFLDTDNHIHIDLWNLLPFTRGYVKILNNDPYLRSFEYNPRYFQNKLDLYGQAAASRLARKLTRSGKLKQFFGEETLPGELLPDDASLEDWARYVKQNFRGNYHGVGTCSMMKKELGGVVDENAKVYGVKNLRVVDGSIPPTQVSSHVMTVFYGMAVKISGAILKDYNDKK